MEDNKTPSEGSSFNLKSLALPLIALLVIAGLGYGYVTKSLPFINTEEDVVEEQVEESHLAATLVVNSPEAEVKEYELDVHDGESAFDVLKELQRTSEDFSFAFSESDFGAYITGVNGYSPDASTHFWKVVVNGEDSQVGVSDLMLEEGDTLEFVVEEIIF